MCSNNRCNYFTCAMCLEILEKDCFDRALNYSLDANVNDRDLVCDECFVRDFNSYRDERIRQGLLYGNRY